MQNLRTPPERIKLTVEAVVICLTKSSKNLGWDELKK